jgi:hypothetical protein
MRAFHTSEGSPAKPHHAAAYVDREDDTAPGKRCPTPQRKTLQNDMRLDDSLGPKLPLCCARELPIGFVSRTAMRDAAIPVLMLYFGDRGASVRKTVRAAGAPIR